MRLSPDRQTMWEAGISHFNAGRFWHAHEDWEGLWKDLKGDAPQALVDGVQGLIQIAAMLFQYVKEKERGVLSLWAKATTKLNPLDGEIFDMDLAGLLAQVEPFHLDVESEQKFGRSTHGIRFSHRQDSQEGGAQND